MSEARGDSVKRGDEASTFSQVSFRSCDATRSLTCCPSALRAGETTAPEGESGGARVVDGEGAAPGSTITIEHFALPAGEPGLLLFHVMHAP